MLLYIYLLYIYHYFSLPFSLNFVRRITFWYLFSSTHSPLDNQIHVQVLIKCSNSIFQETERRMKKFHSALLIYFSTLRHHPYSLDCTTITGTPCIMHTSSKHPSIHTKARHTRLSNVLEQETGKRKVKKERDSRLETRIEYVRP